MKPKAHYTANYLINPSHKVSINLIGAGGTGSNVLSGLAIIDKALVALGHLGLDVTVYDDDKVTESNVGRQLFYEADIGQYKATVLTQRINRAFGVVWNSVNAKYDEGCNHANITISAVDTVKSRMMIKKALSREARTQFQEELNPLYWIDTGNGTSYGQVYVGSVKIVKQPKSEQYDPVNMLQWPSEYFAEQKDEKTDGPSCSLAEALNKQDLLINRIVGNYACHTLWTMFREAKLFYKGIYINLKTLQTNPIQL